MDATAGGWTANRRFVTGAVDVNVTRVRIHVAAAIEAGFESFQPKDAHGDFGVRKFRLRRVADDFARLENRARRFARTFRSTAFG